MKHITIFCFLLITSAVAEESAESLLNRIDGLRGYQNTGFSFNVVNVSFRPDEDAKQNQLAVKVLNDKSLVEFLAPAREKGRAMLKEGNDMWLFIPGTRRVIRISPAQRLLGETSNGDVVGINYSKHYTVTKSIEDESSDTFQLDLVAREKQTLYHRVKFWIQKEPPYLPVKSEYYSQTGKLLKTAHFKEFKIFDGEQKLHKLLLVDPLREGYYTWMLFDDYKKESMSDTAFNKSNLTKL